jgi:hypothetical protein
LKLWHASPRIPLSYCCPPDPWSPSWTIQGFALSTITLPKLRLSTDTILTITIHTYYMKREHTYLATFRTRIGIRTRIQDYVTNDSQRPATLGALLSALKRCPVVPRIRLLYSDRKMPAFCRCLTRKDSRLLCDGIRHEVHRRASEHNTTFTGFCVTKPSGTSCQKDSWTRTLGRQFLDATATRMHNPSTRDVLTTHLKKVWKPSTHCIKHHNYPTFVDDPTLPLRPSKWVSGILKHGHRRTQSTAFQILTGHGFFASYSRRFSPTADDVRACPSTPTEDWNPSHYFEGCGLDFAEKGQLIPHDTLETMLRIPERVGGLCKLLTTTGAFSRPLPKPRPDPP